MDKEIKNKIHLLFFYKLYDDRVSFDDIKRKLMFKVLNCGDRDDDE